MNTDTEVLTILNPQSKKGRPRLSWEETALRLAFDIANYRSQDPFVQVGATIIKNDGSILLGYNGAPAGQEIDWTDRDNRRDRVIHSEENVLTWVKPGEVKILACTALPCKTCMKTIAHKQIKKIIYKDELYGYDNAFSKKLASEFGIELVKLDINV